MRACKRPKPSTPIKLYFMVKLEAFPKKMLYLSCFKIRPPIRCLSAASQNYILTFNTFESLLKPLFAPAQRASALLRGTPGACIIARFGRIRGTLDRQRVLSAQSSLSAPIYYTYSRMHQDFVRSGSSGMRKTERPFPWERRRGC